MTYVIYVLCVISGICYLCISVISRELNKCEVINNMIGKNTKNIFHIAGYLESQSGKEQIATTTCSYDHVRSEEIRSSEISNDHNFTRIYSCGCGKRYLEYMRQVSTYLEVKVIKVPFLYFHAFHTYHDIIIDTVMVNR